MTISTNWFVECVRGNSEACRYLYTALLFDRMARSLKVPVIVVPAPPAAINGKDFDFGRSRAAFDALRVFLGDPNPQPNFPTDAHLGALRDLRDGLSKQISVLDKQITALEKKKK